MYIARYYLIILIFTIMFSFIPKVDAKYEKWYPSVKTRLAIWCRLRTAGEPSLLNETGDVELAMARQSEAWNFGLPACYIYKSQKQKKLKNN